MRKYLSIGLLLIGLFIYPVKAVSGDTPEELYESLQKQLASGWNTWDTRSVLTHVFLPYGFAVDLNLMDTDGSRVRKFRIGDRAKGAPLLQPGPHSFDGAYTKMTVSWRGYKLQVESAATGLKNVILIKPLAGTKPGGRLVVRPESLWKRGNTLTVDSVGFTLASRDKAVEIRTYMEGELTGKNGRDFILSLNAPVAVCCGERMTLSQAVDFVNERAQEFVASNRKRFGGNYDCYNAMQSVLAWDNIYDPGIRRVITPVSRIWSSEWFASEDFGGFTLFSLGHVFCIDDACRRKQGAGLCECCGDNQGYHREWVCSELFL